VFVRYPPARIRYEGDRPAALLKVRIAPSYRLLDLPLGTPTTSARTGRGTWALYPVGAEVVVVHPDGAISGLAADAAAEVGRLAAQERQGELDRKAAQTIQHLLTGDVADGAGPLRRLGARTWSIPATAYWLSGPSNDQGTPTAASRPGGSASKRSPARRPRGRRPAWHRRATRTRRPTAPTSTADRAVPLCAPRSPPRPTGPRAAGSLVSWRGMRSPRVGAASTSGG
jgi:hypothetical protein